MGNFEIHTITNICVVCLGVYVCVSGLMARPMRIRCAGKADDDADEAVVSCDHFMADVSCDVGMRVEKDSGCHTHTHIRETDSEAQRRGREQFGMTSKRNTHGWRLGNWMESGYKWLMNELMLK